MPEDRVYLLHHFNCPTCCAAGLSGGKLQRCPDGLRLWSLYMRAFQMRLRKAPETMTASTTHTLQRIYRINKAAEMLGISRSTTYRLIKCGKLVMVKISERASGVTAESLEKHMSS